MPLTISNPARIAVACAFALLAGGAFGQRYPTPEPPPLTVGPCKPTRKDPCPPAPAAATPAPAAPEAFPFPGETSQDAPPAAPVKAVDKAAPATPQAFPFPGEPPEEPSAPSANPAPASGSSSSSSSTSGVPADPDEPALKDEGSAGSTRFSRRKLPKVVIVDPDQRGTRDLEVSHYYFSTGNFEASYMRAKDAIANIPDDPAAHLALAEAAVHLQKTAEALAEYKSTLQLDPNDQQAKAARKGMAELAAAKPVSVTKK